MSVDQQHRGPGATVPHPEPDFSHVHVVQLKAVEHGYHSGKPPPQGSQRVNSPGRQTSRLRGFANLKRPGEVSEDER